jgi:hypothetical protein
LSIQIHGAVPDAISAPLGGATAYFYRYELGETSLVRRKVSDTRPHENAEARLVDVLVNEDASGRHIGVMRGILVPERDLARMAAVAPNWREFEVGLDVRLAICRDLGVGPFARKPLRLVTVDGRRLDDDASLGAVSHPG